MFLIPYLYKSKESIYPIHLFYIFLNKGKLFLQINPEELDDFCNENGFHYNKKTINGDYCYLEINKESTDIKNFYSFIDNDEAECWRRFIYIGNDDEDFLHINNTNPEFIVPVIKEIFKLL